jgi:uncharacterized repeat protein (TIGR01451 family)
MTPKLTRDRKTLSTLLSRMLGRVTFSLLCMAALGGTVTSPVQAEGSREMVADGGDRPFTEWTTGFTAGIPRQTVLQVFVQAGETVYFGSSVYDSANGNADIVYRTPTGQQGSCNVRNNNGRGWIDSLAKEAAGPRPLNANGYRPCEIATGDTETGIYKFEFRAPSTNVGQNPPTTSATDPFPTDASQETGIAAWDITVVSASGVEQTGRVFTNYVALNMGNNNQELASNFYIQTWDGYLYRTDMNNVDPYGFIFFGNSRGFLDSDGSTLYHSARATNNELSPFQGGVTVQNPAAANDPSTNTYTHLVFFNQPAPETLTYLGIPPTAELPQQPTGFTFVGLDSSDNQTLEGAGGYFEFTVASGISYQIILDTNLDGTFDTINDRVLENTLQPGFNQVFWDGQDADGVDLPPRSGNSPYSARITVRSGEYHFPMLDAENNSQGFIIEMLNPPQGFPELYDMNGSRIDRWTIYYDDSNYTTVNGTEVVLEGETGATNPVNAGLGINSASGEHEFTNNYGNFLGIDTWAFFPSEALTSEVIVTDGSPDAEMILVKRMTAVNGAPITDNVDGINSPGDLNHVGTQEGDDNHANWPDGFLLGHIRREDLQPGDEVEFTVYFLSSGSTTAQNALFCDLVPANMDFVTDAFASIPAASGPSPVPGITSGGERGIVLGLGTQSTTDPYPIEVSLSNSDDSDAGRYIAPNVDLTTIDFRLSSCGSNTNGAIVVNLGDLPDATSAGDPANSYGFVRFRGRIR